MLSLLYLTNCAVFVLFLVPEVSTIRPILYIHVFGPIIRIKLKKLNLTNIWYLIKHNSKDTLAIKRMADRHLNQLYWFNCNVQSSLLYIYIYIYMSSSKWISDSDHYLQRVICEPSINHVIDLLRLVRISYMTSSLH